MLRSSIIFQNFFNQVRTHISPKKWNVCRKHCYLNICHPDIHTYKINMKAIVQFMVWAPGLPGLPTPSISAGLPRWAGLPSLPKGMLEAMGAQLILGAQQILMVLGAQGAQEDQTEGGSPGSPDGESPGIQKDVDSITGKKPFPLTPEYIAYCAKLAWIFSCVVSSCEYSLKIVTNTHLTLLVFTHWFPCWLVIHSQIFPPTCYPHTLHGTQPVMKLGWVKIWSGWKCGPSEIMDGVKIWDYWKYWLIENVG